jgi:protein gp37
MFSVIDRCPSLDFLLLTKRPENIASMWAEANGLAYPLRENVWLGTSIANQRNADEFVDRLLIGRTISPTLFLSIEPQIDFVDLSDWLRPEPKIDWVICGGESQQGGEARRFDIRWARILKDQCEEANVPFFMKQYGSNAWDGKRRLTLKDSHGGDWMEWEPALRIRECPESYFPQLA